jgi:ArsR family transcriptional regulator
MKRQLAILKGLADQTRVRIVQMLFEGPHCVEEITTRLKMSQPRVSRHLRILRECGLVNTRRDRRRIYYSLGGENNPAVSEILGFLEDWLAEAAPASPSTKRSVTTVPDRGDDLPSPSVSDLEDFLL